MKKVTLIALGRLKEPYLRESVDEYQKRLSRFCDLQIRELTPAKLPDQPNEAQINIALETEAEQILKQIPKQTHVVALCIEGKSLTSEAFSLELGNFGHTTFIIGSSYGLSERVKQRADLRLSMSNMTFPHQLARVLLLEQIYRGFQIMEGGAYHK